MVAIIRDRPVRRLLRRSIPDGQASGASEDGIRTILVTGGAGFVGSHLVERLLERPGRVYCIDNFHTGRRDNLAAAMATGRLTIVDHDIAVPIADDLPRFDEIYNLACPASPVHYQDDPVSTLRTCSLGAFNVLDRAARDGARLFHASTSEVYGDPDVHPQPEGYFGNVNCTGPRACYDEGKRFAETLMLDFARQRGVTVRIARIFNTYGPRMQPDDGRVVSNFIVQALEGDDLTIYGDGGQTRSFCYVNDLVEGICRLMAAGEAASGPMNLGNPVETSVFDLAEIVIGMTGSCSRIVEHPLPQDDPKRRRPDIGRAMAVLDWKPRVALAEGLAATIDYFRGEMDAFATAPRTKRAACR